MKATKVQAGASCKPKQPQTKAGAKLNMGGMMMKQKPGYSYGGMPKKKKS